METIVAVASPPGGGARGIVRLSGPKAVAIARTVVRWPRRTGRPAVAASLVQPFQLPILLLLMPAPHSYTREDVIEFHLPGSPPLLRALVEELCARGARAARPGEFTLRAFLNGRLDLAQAEAVEAMISASSDIEARAAASQLEGDFSAPLREVEDGLMSLAADVEAAIDFVDQDIEIISAETVQRRAGEISKKLEDLVARSASRRVENVRPVVALFGKPNAGKSTLFNRLSGGEALVSDRPGTTRDLLTAEVEEFTLVDAAGQDESGGEAVRRAWRAAEGADLVLHVVDATDPDFSLIEKLKGRPCLTILNKSDLAVGKPVHTGERVCTSALLGTGIEEVRAAIRERLKRGDSGPETRFFVTIRQRGLLMQALESIRRARKAAAEGIGMEFVSMELREGLMAAGAVTGRQVTEDLLDRIFERFCLGK